MKTQIQTIIFSYNRALQLDSLLASILECFSTNNLAITVVYNSSSNEFEQGYTLLRSKYKSVDFIRESGPGKFSLLLLGRVRNLYRAVKYSWLRNPRSNFRQIVERLLQKGNAEFVMFFTDDSIFYRDARIDEDVLELIRNNPEKHSYKLSLGKNINGMPDSAVFYNNMVCWNYYSSDTHADWAYPFSVDGVIYHRKTLAGITEKILYANPNSFEAFVVEYVKRKKLFSGGYCPAQSALIGFELNRVQNVALNNNLDFSPQLLNDYFLKGFTLRYSYTSPTLFHPDLINIILTHSGTGEEITALIEDRIS